MTDVYGRQPRAVVETTNVYDESSQRRGGTYIQEKREEKTAWVRARRLKTTITFWQIAL